MEKVSDENERRKIIATAMVSPLASVIAKYAVHPIDTIKSKIQARSASMHKLSEYKLGHSL